MFIIGQLVNMARNGSGHIRHGNAKEDINTGYTPLADGIPEIDPSKPGIGFCFSSEEKKLYEVTGNDVADYQPFCFGEFN